jgi:hypothetical protein
MMFQEGDHKWFASLDDTKVEGYFPVKVSSPLQFFTLKGRTSTVTRSNIEVIRYLHYALFSPQENRYYFKMFRAYDLDTFYFYRRTETFSGESEEVANLRRYIEDGNIWLLMSKAQVTDTTALLERLWKANLTGDGKLPYQIYLQVLETSLQFEDYKEVGKNLTGFKTVCNQFQLKLNELWKSAYDNKR